MVSARTDIPDATANKKLSNRIRPRKYAPLKKNNTIT
jgi:hypothetical protein|tara:strand:- start:184 stop:294 length:111 start_codon:yes stop_codon:yes gene_type:complete